MPSRRASWDLSENPLAAALAARGARGAPVLDLVESNPTRVGLGPSAAELLVALAAPEIVRYEPSPRGLHAAREAVARHHGGVDPGRIVLTASTSEAYSFVFKLLCDPGDEVLVPRPSYPLFDYLAGLESVEARPYRLERDGCWRIDLDSVERALSARTRAVVLVHPNNPTGTFVKRAEVEAIAALARTRGVALVSDEVFADYGFAPDADRAGLAAARQDVPAFSLSGLSKPALVPQVKLGWIVVGGPPEERDDALARLEVIADTYLSVSASAQHGAARLLDAGRSARAALSGRLARNLATLRASVAGPVELLEPEGGWYAVLRLPRTRSDDEWALLLLESEGLHVHPGSFYDFEDRGCLVVSLILEPDVFADGIGRLLRRVG